MSLSTRNGCQHAASVTFRKDDRLVTTCISCGTRDRGTSDPQRASQITAKAIKSMTAVRSPIYAAYLTSEHWKTKRLAKLMEVGYRCQGCGRKQYREPADAHGCTCMKDE